MLNCGQAVGEYQIFWYLVSTGTGVYETFIVKKRGASTQRMATLAELLDKK